MRTFKKRIFKPFFKLLNTQAYLHWYINEGMELQDFKDARQNLEYLEQDYLDVVYEANTDDYSTD